MSWLGDRVVNLKSEHGPIVLAIDGPALAEPTAFGERLADWLRAAGRPVAVIRDSALYRDASLRLEYGRDDIESFYSSWLDVEAIQREVLDPLRHDEPHYLPALRDSATNRSVRIPPQSMAVTGVVLLCGELLLGRGMTFELSIHLAVTRAARIRRCPPQLAWTLPAFDRYDHEVDPMRIADVVIRYDDPGHPAVSR
jgi:hypothetical protein